MAPELVPSSPQAQPEDLNASRNNGSNGSQPGAPPESIRAFDQNGREVIVPREEWRTNVLPGMLQQAWESPDQLAAAILNSLNDAFVAEVTDAAAHLYATDTVPVRGTCIWAIVLIQSQRLPEAEQVLNLYIEQHGEDASVLVNLAKVYSEQGDADRAAQTLWRAIEVDPNHDNAIGWFVSQAQQQGGDDAARAALDRVGALPNAWRPRLWLARAALAQQDLDAAKNLYTEAIERAPRPVPPDFLMQMSGDLGGAGHLLELLNFTAPHFVPELHGLPVGNNLIKAAIDTGNVDVADAVRASLVPFNRPDWAQALVFWESEIQRVRAGGSPSDPNQQQIQIGMIRVDGPIWLPPVSPARQIFGAKPAGSPTVTFMGGTAEAPAEPNAAQQQLADALGRLTRSLPLYLAEQTDLRTFASGRALLPWAIGPRSGFVVSGSAWPDQTAVQATLDPANLSDYVVTVHIDADNDTEDEPWAALLTFIRTSDGTRIGELQAEFLPQSATGDDAPGEAIPQLANEVVELLSALGPAPGANAYEAPSGPAFTNYLLRLEQLLAVRCATMEGVPPQFLQGEADILEAQLNDCLANPGSIPARLLLVETFAAMQRIRPAVVEAFRPQMERLIVEHPLPAVDNALALANLLSSAPRPA